jgi:hypothetical protein
MRFASLSKSAAIIRLTCASFGRIEDGVRSRLRVRMHNNGRHDAVQEKEMKKTVGILGLPKEV